MNRREHYPEIEPHESGLLDVGDGHHLAWERVGTPGAKPAVFLHGGPGGGCRAMDRRLWDPAAYDIILFDQRGAGKSTPKAAVDNNTTWKLVEDIERLRCLFGFESWQVLGGSWGSLLALVYAIQHPERVTELILRGIFMGRQAELDWLYQGGAAQLFPDSWQGFLAPIPAEEQNDLVTAYHPRLMGDDQIEAGRCARAWSIWESSISRLRPEPPEVLQAMSDEFCLAFARIENHFFVNKCFFDSDDWILSRVKNLRDIPTTLIHGRYDAICTVNNAYELHQALPASTFALVGDAGHSASEPGIVHEFIVATDAAR